MTAGLSADGLTGIVLPLITIVISIAFCLPTVSFTIMSAMPSNIVAGKLRNFYVQRLIRDHCQQQFGVGEQFFALVAAVDFDLRVAAALESFRQQDIVVPLYEIGNVLRVEEIVHACR